MIDIDKKYQTRDGRAVRLISNNGTPEYPIIGVIAGQPLPSSWSHSGHYTNPRSAEELQHDWDLVPVPEKVTMYAAAATKSYNGEATHISSSIRGEVAGHGRRIGPVLEVDLPIDSKPEAPPAPRQRAGTYVNRGPYEVHNCLWLRVERKHGPPLKVLMPEGLAIRLRDAFNEVPQ